MNDFLVEYRTPELATAEITKALGSLFEMVKNGSSRLDIRNGIKRLELEILKFPQTKMPLTHQFCDGLYIRTIFNPKGAIIVTEIHREQNVSTILAGKLLCITEDGQEVLNSPSQFITKPGTKRVLFAEEDVLFSTIHPNPLNITDIDELERRLIAPDFESIEWTGEIL